MSRRTVLLLVSVATAAAGSLSVACSSNDTDPAPGSSGTVYVDSGAPEPDSASASDSATTIPPGSVELSKGPCSSDVDCKTDARGTVACFIGGMGGGAGDGGGATTANGICTFKCSPTGAADTTVCGPPFGNFCNNRGFCRLP